MDIIQKSFGTSQPQKIIICYKRLGKIYDLIGNKEKETIQYIEKATLIQENLTGVKSVEYALLAKKLAKYFFQI